MTDHVEREAAPGFEALRDGEAIAEALRVLMHPDECSGYEDAMRRVVVQGWDVHFARLVQTALKSGTPPRDVAMVLFEVTVELCPPEDDLRRALLSLAHCAVELGKHPFVGGGEPCETHAPDECVMKELVHAVSAVFTLPEDLCFESLRGLVLAVGHEYEGNHVATFVREVERRLTNAGALA